MECSSVNSKPMVNSPLCMDVGKNFGASYGAVFDIDGNRRIGTAVDDDLFQHAHDFVEEQFVLKSEIQVVARIHADRQNGACLALLIFLVPEVNPCACRDEQNQSKDSDALNENESEQNHQERQDGEGKDVAVDRGNVGHIG